MVVVKKVVVTMVDDLDKKSPADETVEFSVDGVAYEIDLTAAHAAELRDALKRWIPHARKSNSAKSVNGAVTKSRPVADRDQSAAIREWAKGAGFEISARGRISTEVRRAYEKAV
ncbi:Lsr2 family protein [Rhodococcus sp. WS1]|jgi:hypothetical protein|nr:Lsr2 family protein [Rhodococcus erythropolis]ROZ60564.1 Lsr2 family protein [Rhodococcus sp. WS1]TQC35098.1 Lsr2 family protein [Rhodococcus sp. WS7]